MGIFEARLVFTIIRNIVSGCLFLAPSPTVVQIVKNQSVGENTPIPYLVTLGNCMVWCVYGLPVMQAFGAPTLITNGIGVGIMGIYIFMYIKFCGQAKQRLVIMVVMVVEVILVVAFATLTVALVDSRGIRRFVIGCACCICNVFVYVAPVSTLIKVVKTKSVEHMSFLVALAMFTNAIVWTTFSDLPLHPIMLISFGFCTLLGLVQLIVYATYYRSTQRIMAARQLQSIV